MEPDQGEQSVPQDLLGEDDTIDHSEPSTQSFIVKIWLEETAAEANRATWRGHITQVPSGERRYLENLDDIGIFILPYLEEMGVRFGDRG
jgi:hypothetical protein